MSGTNPPESQGPEDLVTKPVEKEPSSTFLTGVEVDMDQWRQETVEELTSWLEDIKNKKTEFGDPLVEFPEGWDKDINLTQNQQFDLISAGIAKNLTGNEAKEAQLDLQNIRQQADKLRALDKQLNALDSDSDHEDQELSKEDQDILDEEIVVPNIDTSGPNPFEIPEDDLKRLKEIDEQLGIVDDDTTEPKKTITEINEELLKLYSAPESTNKSNDSNNSSPDDSKAQSSPGTAESTPKSPPPGKALKSAPAAVPPISMKPTTIASKPIPPLQQLESMSKPTRTKKSVSKK